MTLTELRYVVTLAKEEHFGRAAERCNVSQPTLSIAIKRLEEELEVAIFERSKNRVYPTPLGEKLIEQAHRVLENAKCLQDMAQEGKGQLTSPLSVGAIFTVGPYLFPNLIPNMRDLAPEMPLYVEEGFTATMRQSLRQGEVDAIVVSLPFTEADVVTQVLYEEDFVVLMHKDHALTKLDTIPTSLLAEENLLLLGEGHCFRDQILKFCPDLKEAMDSSQGRIRTANAGSSLETLKYMVASQLGITILPKSAALGRGSSDDILVLRPFEDPKPSRSVALAWRASFPRLQAIDILRNAVMQFAETQGF